jgi:hypothetical protein
MSLSITQTPAEVNLAQSPIIFTVSESTSVINSSSFQYYADLYYWIGTPNQSGSVPQYTLAKYPNASNVGIFDVSKVINSVLTASAQQNSSNVTYMALDFYWEFLSGSTYVSSSKTKSLRYKGIDGYSTFQEPIGQQITSKSLHWPLMTSGPATQSFFEDNIGNLTVYTGYAETFNVVPTRVVYSGSLGNGSINVSGSLSSSQQTQYVPIGPAQSGFPLSAASEFYTIQAYNTNTPLGKPIRFEYKCKQKYPNVRLKWKNKFGQFDWFNFDMVNRQSFTTTNRNYQPQIGSWTAPTLSYQNFESSNLNYIVDSEETITVNTDWVSQDYNNIFKQLLVSEEIYWISDEAANTLEPITISTPSIEFKTGVVDNLIQYQFDFNRGQGFKLIL